MGRAGVMLLAGALGLASCTSDAERRGSSDSHASAASRDPGVGVRVAWKQWGSWTPPCGGDEWGWDTTTTFRLEPGEDLPEDRFHILSAPFRLGIRAADGRHWLRYPRGSLLPMGEQAGASIPPGPDSVLIGNTWTGFYTPSIDGGILYRIKLVTPWPEPERRVMLTQLSGRVTDGFNGRPLAYVGVIVDRTPVEAHTDTTGHFTLNRVPVGEVTVVACGPCRFADTLRITVPESGARDLALVLARDPHCGFLDR